MTHGATAFLSYLWHYLAARLVYDQLIRPVIHGHLSLALVACCVAAGAFLLGRWTGTHSNRRFAARGRR